MRDEWRSAPGNGEAPIHPTIPALYVKEERLLSTYFSATAMRSRNGGSGLSWAMAALFRWRQSSAPPNVAKNRGNVGELAA